jgi:hypothetical protein
LPSIRNAGTDRARLLGAAEDPSVYHIAHDDFGRRTRLATSLHSAHPALNSSIFRLVAIGLCSPHSTMPSSLHFGMSSRPSTAIHATSPAQGPLFFFSGIATHQSRGAHESRPTALPRRPTRCGASRRWGCRDRSGPRSGPDTIRPPASPFQPLALVSRRGRVTSHAPG